jgi:hypothetical protein
MGDDIYGSELISSEADDLRIENQQLNYIWISMIWKLPVGRQLSLVLIRQWYCFLTTCSRYDTSTNLTFLPLEP